MGDKITSLEALRNVYPPSQALNYDKVLPRLAPEHQKWIENARFCLIATMSEHGPDISPRGDNGPVVHVRDSQALLLPDWRGNNRLDTLSNIVTNPQVSLLFLHHGHSIVMRVKGQAQISISPEVCALFSKKNAVPKSVIEIKIEEVFVHCGRAIMRSGLWFEPSDPALPSIGSLLTEATKGDFDGATYDRNLDDRYAKTLWQDEM